LSWVEKYLRQAITELECAQFECEGDEENPRDEYENVHRAITDILFDANAALNQVHQLEQTK